MVRLVDWLSLLVLQPEVPFAQKNGGNGDQLRDRPDKYRIQGKWNICNGLLWFPPYCKRRNTRE